MPEQDKPIVINDRRKFRGDGELRTPEAHPATEPAANATETPASTRLDAPASGPIAIDSVHTNSAHLITPVPEPAEETSSPYDEELSPEDDLDGELTQPEMPAPPTPEEIEQVRAAYEQTTERLDTMMRSQNLGGERVPPMDFARLVQSIYMSAMLQLGAGTQQGQQARVDLIGAKQSIDMLSVIADKAGSNLSGEETRLLDSALFELRMGFLEITQLLARQAAAKQPPAANPGQTGAGGFGGSGFTGAGPRIVR
ncbi:MAG: DUF1844 domain-containing protein [Janthinobacterium lividum]